MRVRDYVFVAVIAFASVWLINHGLAMAGLAKYRA